jgi:molecular chaperone GrpE (heat shock protein)
MMKMEQDFAEMQRNFQKTNQTKMEIDRLITERTNERAHWENIREGQQAKINELDRAYRALQGDYTKVKADYDRLCDTLQSNISKTILTTVHDFRR